MLRPLIKSGSCLRNIPISGIRVSSRTITRSFSYTRPVQFFGGKDKSEPTAEQLEKIQKFTETIRTNPEIGQLLNGFKDLLEVKGMSTGGKPPTITQMMRIFADKDIREQLSKLKDAFEKANIQVKQDDLSVFTDVFLSHQKNTEK
ncbi:uncharacterized protein RJT21DRAFT_120621 [Scheffersomyces amazonensis]|uniref:uncharacterized protein n=1 Tax=Scheffersomyces amazonensis TaxID=1078765 RepID=UPI00315CD26C